MWKVMQYTGDNHACPGFTKMAYLTVQEDLDWDLAKTLAHGIKGCSVVRMTSG